jgi:hypothetical protein
MPTTDAERRDRSAEKPASRFELTNRYASIGIPAVAAAAPYAKPEGRKAKSTPSRAFDLRFEITSSD